MSAVAPIDDATVARLDAARKRRSTAEARAALLGLVLSKSNGTYRLTRHGFCRDLHSLDAVEESLRSMEERRHA